MRFHFIPRAILVCAIAAVGPCPSAQAEEKNAAPPAEQPSKETPDATPEKPVKPVVAADVVRNQLALHRRHLLEAYRKHGQRDPRWDDKVEVFLEEWASLWADTLWQPTPKDLSVLADGAVKAGCNDPLVRAGQMIAQYRANDTPSPQFLDMARELAESKYAPYISAYCAGAAARFYGAKDRFDEENFRASTQLVFDQAERCLTGDWIQPGEERAAYDTLEVPFGVNVSLWPDRETRIQKLVDDAKQEHHQWLANMLAATFCRHQGWAARGSGYAASVTEEGWRIFGANIAHMTEHLRTAYKLKPEHPEAASGMITAIVNGQGKEGETIYNWFARAVEAQPDYEAAYSQMFNFGLPRWGGNYELIEKVGRVGLDSGRFDTFAPHQFFLALAAIARDDRANELNYWQTEMPKHYSDLERMFAGYEASEAMKSRRLYFRSLHAVMAFHAERYEDALAELRKMDNEMHRTALRYAFFTYKGFVESIHALGGEAGPQVRQAKKLISQEQYADAEKLLLEAKQKYEDAKDTPATVHIKQLLAVVDLQKKLQTHEWVDLTFDENFTGWSRAFGKWKLKDEKTVIGTPAADGLQLNLIAPVGHRLQLRGEIQIPKTRFATDSAGVHVATSSKPVMRGINFLLFPQPEKPRVYLGLGSGRTDHRPADVRLDRNQFEITLWDKVVQAKLNGTVIQSAHWLADEAEFAEEERIGLGGDYWYEGPEIIFRNLQIRKPLNPPEGF